MIRKIVTILAAAVCLGSSAITALAATREPFSSREYGFSASLVSESKVGKMRKSTPGEDLPYPAGTLICMSPRKTEAPDEILVAIADGAATRPEQVKMLKTITETAVKGMSSETITSTVEYSDFEGFPCSTIVAKAKNPTDNSLETRTRIVVTKNFIYNLNSAGPKGWLSKSESMALIRSFHLLKE